MDHKLILLCEQSTNYLSHYDHQKMRCFMLETEMLRESAKTLVLQACYIVYVY
jgi:hypothetical protein